MGAVKYLVTIQHPAQAQFYRHPVTELRDRGHDVRVLVRDKDVTTDLLDAFDIPHRVLARSPNSVGGLPLMQLRYEYRLFREALRFRPHVMTSVGGLEISHVAPLVGARSVAFDDSEWTPSRRITLPSLDAVWTPRAFAADRGTHQRYYDGYHELSYLHPDRFEPDPDRLRAAGVDPDDRYFVLRFVAWNAHHDVGQAGFSPAAKRRLVGELERLGNVYVSTEADVPDEFEQYRLPVPPHLLQDLLYYADLYVGDSQTMATEAAILGTPAVRSNSFAGEGDMSNFVELEEEYGLLHSIPDEDAAVDRALELAADSSSKTEWRRRREALLADKIDVAGHVVSVLEREGERARQRPAEKRGVAGWVRDLLGRWVE